MCRRVAALCDHPIECVPATLLEPCLGGIGWTAAELRQDAATAEKKQPEQSCIGIRSQAHLKVLDTDDNVSGTKRLAEAAKVA